MERKKINKLKLFAVLITTTLVFLIGIFFGNVMGNSQLDKIMVFQQDLRTQTLSLELQYALASQDLCKGTNWNTVGNELYNMGETLGVMEGSLGKLNKDVLSLKKYYSLLEVKHWLFLKNVKKECKVNIPTILFFYSNLGDCDKCEDQGYVLTYLKKKNLELSVFSFDINMNDAVLDGLKKIYNIKSDKLPVIVVGDKVFVGFTELDKINEFISKDAM